MAQTLIIAIPGVIALLVCAFRGPEQALLNVYLPVLLFLPQFYTWPFSGQFTFADTAILPIAIWFLFQPKATRLLDSIDLLVIVYLAITLIAEGVNKGYKLGSQNLALHELGGMLLPYLVARRVFRNQKFAVEAAKRVVTWLAIIAVISVYEFRMGSDLFTHFFDGVFPPNIGTVVLRGGFMRTQGPFGHAITAGIMMVIGFRLARWLEWTGAWTERTPLLGIGKLRLCETLIVAGSIMTLSLSPLLAAGCGAVAVAVCRAHNRKRAILALILVVTFVGPPVYSGFKAYVSVPIAKAEAAGDQLQQDSAYRDMLMPLYVPVVMERPAWGWGRNAWPVLDGMWSIDNGYLLTALTFGIYALVLQAMLWLWVPIRLAIFSLALARDDPRAIAGYTIIGIFVLIIFMNGTTAFGGGPSERFLFMIIGWSATLISGAVPATAASVAKVSPRSQFAFRRVMA